MTGFAIEIEPGRAPGTWAWEINIDGTPHCWGATAGQKDEVLKKLKIYIKRRMEAAPKQHKNSQPTPKSTSAFIGKPDQILRSIYPMHGWQKTYEMLDGKFTKQQIQRRAAYLGVKCERYAKRSRWNP